MQGEEGRHLQVRAFFSYELDKVLYCRNHVLLLFVAEIYSMYQLLAGQGKDTDISLPYGFYIGHKSDAEVFFHQCGYGVFIGAFTCEFGGNSA